MGTDYKTVLQNNQPNIVQNIVDIDAVLDFMLSDHVISDSLFETISSKPTNRFKARELISTIRRLGKLAFDSFLNALQETNQLELLDNISNDLEKCPMPKSSYDEFSLFNLLSSQGIVPSKLKTDAVSHKQKFEPYKITSDPKGLVLIINNEQFDPKSGVSNRPGSSVDADKFNKIFTEFGYRTRIKANLNSDDLRNCIKDFVTNPRMEDVDSAVLVIMTHGLEEQIIAADGFLVDVSEIVSYFSNNFCPALSNKPKLIILQACRGEYKNHESADVTDVKLVVAPKDNFTPSHENDKLPYLSDCIIAYSTLPGFVSWRSESDGSWYVQVLYEVLMEYGRDTHILDILTQVNRKLVEQAEDKNCLQISQPVSTLTRPFFLVTDNITM